MATCNYFNSNDKADVRKGCCGICSNFDSVESKCKIEKEVIKWARTTKWEDNNGTNNTKS